MQGESELTDKRINAVSADMIKRMAIVARLKADLADLSIDWNELCDFASRHECEFIISERIHDSDAGGAPEGGAGGHDGVDNDYKALEQADRSVLIDSTAILPVLSSADFASVDFKILLWATQLYCVRNHDRFNDKKNSNYAWHLWFGTMDALQKKRSASPVITFPPLTKHPMPGKDVTLITSPHKSLKYLPNGAVLMHYILHVDMLSFEYTLMTMARLTDLDWTALDLTHALSLAHQSHSGSYRFSVCRRFSNEDTIKERIYMLCFRIGYERHASVYFSLYDILLLHYVNTGDFVVGLVSEQDMWRLVWLPCHDSIMQCGELDSVIDQCTTFADFPTETQSEVSPDGMQSRVLHCTEAMHVSDKWLSRAVASVLLKATKATPAPSVSIGRRLLEVYYHDRWEWGRLSRWAVEGTGAPRAFSLRAPLKGDGDLRDATKKHYCLRVTTNSVGYDTFISTNDVGALYVIKTFTSSEYGKDYEANKRNEEIKNWYFAYELRLPAITVCSAPAMVMPLILTFSDSGVPPDVSPDGLLRRLFPHSHCEADLSLFRELSEQLIAAGASEWTAPMALEVAIDDLRRKGWYHPNLKWSHVGLMPIFGNDPKYAAMVTMSDSGSSVSNGEGSKRARTARARRLRNLITAVHPVLIDLDSLQQTPSSNFERRKSSLLEKFPSASRI
jgi:hypothetical protein